jgi:hypothetical protein
MKDSNTESKKIEAITKDGELFAKMITSLEIGNPLYFELTKHFSSE